MFNGFHDRFTKVLDKNAPFKLLSHKRSKLAHKPWISKGILASIRNKQKMYKTHFNCGSEIAKTSYKAYANKLTKVKCLAKKLYFHSELENCKGDGSKIWDLLYSLLPSKKNKQCPKTLEVGGDITHDPKLIALQFCEHFSTIPDSHFIWLTSETGRARSGKMIRFRSGLELVIILTRS